jgi:hypothetical protein
MNMLKRKHQGLLRSNFPKMKRRKGGFNPKLSAMLSTILTHHSAIDHHELHDLQYLNSIFINHLLTPEEHLGFSVLLNYIIKQLDKDLKNEERKHKT